MPIPVPETMPSLRLSPLVRFGIAVTEQKACAPVPCFDGLELTAYGSCSVKNLYAPRPRDRINALPAIHVKMCRPRLLAIRLIQEVRP
jgi:hypothetical protein